MKDENLLVVADTEHDANMLYAVGMHAPDPFIYLRLRGKCFIVMSDLEIDRARRQTRHCRVLSLSRCARQLRHQGIQAASLAQVVRLILAQHGVRRVSIPANFPYGLARELRKLKVKLRLKDGPFFPQRQVKTAAEVKKVNAALTMAEVGLAEGIQVLRSARAGKDRKLFHHGVPLSCEKLRSIIEVAIIQAGGIANHSIVAAGKQGCDPHEIGFGPLRVDEPIILDIFPRSQKTGYFGDITRTVVKGKATEAVRRLYHTVARGQELAFGKMRHNVAGLEIHRTVEDFFAREGYRTCRHRGHMEGFFHGTGHGLGLEIHEPPQLNRISSDVLKAGNVVTVEPGLYYPRIGGVRIEDVALITADGARNLTKFEKVLEV